MVNASAAGEVVIYQDYERIATHRPVPPGLRSGKL
jgi:hypothetical protein